MIWPILTIFFALFAIQAVAIILAFRASSGFEYFRPIRGNPFPQATVRGTGDAHNVDQRGATPRPATNLQKTKQSVVLARLRRAVRGGLRIASAIVNSAGCPQIRNLPEYSDKELKGNRDAGSKEKSRGKGESLSQKPLRECGIASPAPAQQKVEANPKSDYAPQSPIMVGATNFNSECTPELRDKLKARFLKTLSALPTNNAGISTKPNPSGRNKSSTSLGLL